MYRGVGRISLSYKLARVASILSTVCRRMSARSISSFDHVSESHFETTRATLLETFEH